MIEYIILFPVMVMLVLGAVQFALIYQAKATLDYATFMAARQGALKNAKKLYIKDGLAEGMTPLFANGSDLPGMLRGRAVAMIEAFNPLTTDVEILNPTKATFNAYAVNGEMPNDNLMYRSASVKSGATENIQDANVLTIRVKYCVPLIVPLVNKAIYSLYFGYKEIVHLSGASYEDTKGSNPNPDTTCEDLRDKLHDKVVSGISAANGVLGGAIPTDLASTLTSIGKTFPTTIPILDWNIAGYRIPIYATATVRMQSPAKM